MRIILSLIIASVVGSAAVGTLTRYMSKTSDQDAKQTLRELFDKDRPAALHLLERTASTCVPELAQLKSNNARKLFPRIIIMRLDTMERSGDRLTKEESALIDKEVQQLIRAIPESDAPALTAAVDRMEKDKARFHNCVSNALADIVRNEQRKQRQPILSDVELRGS